MQEESVASRIYTPGLDIDLESEVIMADGRAVSKKVRQSASNRFASYVYHYDRTLWSISFLREFSSANRLIRIDNRSHYVRKNMYSNNACMRNA